MEIGESRADLIKEYGNPNASKTFHPPVIGGSIPAFQRYKSPDIAKRTLIAKEEIYSVRGIRSSGGDVPKLDVLAWNSASTFWLAEPILSPFAAAESAASYIKSENLTVWLDQKDRIVWLYFVEE